jgi:hypothetical protein
MGIFLAFTTAMLILAEVVGNQGISKGIMHLTDSTEGVGVGLVSAIRAAVPPATEAAVSLGADMIAPTLDRISKSIAGVVNLTSTLEGLRCMNGSLQTLPDVPGAVVKLGGEAAAQGRIDADATRLSNDIDAMWFAQNATLSNASALYDVLGDLGSAFRAVNDSLRLADALAIEAVGARTLWIAPPPGGLTTLPLADIASLGAIWPPSSVWDAITGAAGGGSSTLDALVAGSLEGDPTNMLALSTKLRSALATLQTLPDFSATAQQLTWLNGNLSSFAAPGGPLETLVGALQNVTAIFASFPTGV